MILPGPNPPRRYPPPAAWCRACGCVVPCTPTGRCVDCAALAEARAMRAVERRDPAALVGPDVDDVIKAQPAGMRRFVTGLTDPQLGPFLEHYMLGLGPAEIARDAGLSKPSMTRMLERVRRAMKAAGLPEFQPRRRPR